MPMSVSYQDVNEPIAAATDRVRMIVYFLVVSFLLYYCYSFFFWNDEYNRTLETWNNKKFNSRINCHLSDLITLTPPTVRIMEFDCFCFCFCFVLFDSNFQLLHFELSVVVASLWDVAEAFSWFKIEKQKNVAAHMFIIPFHNAFFYI